MKDKRYSGSLWRRIRAEVLARDGGVCQMRETGCLIKADTVDHIVPVAQGGAFYDLGNLRAACKKCNYGAGQRLRTKHGWTINRDKTISVTTDSNQAKRWRDSYPDGAVFNFLEIRASIGDFGASQQLINYIINMVKATKLRADYILFVVEPHEIYNVPHHHLLDKETTNA